MSPKWLAPAFAYLALWAGLFSLKSAWGALLGFHLVILAALFFFRAETPSLAALKNARLKTIFLSTALCGLSGVGLSFFWNKLQLHPNLPAQLKNLGLNASSWPPFIAYFSLVNPLLEEYFWRGLLGGAQKSPQPGDFIYAGYHALILYGRASSLSIVAALVLLTAAGWFWRQLAREDGGLLAPILGHAAADFAILICLMYITA